MQELKVLCHQQGQYVRYLLADIKALNRLSLELINCEWLGRSQKPMVYEALCRVVVKQPSDKVRLFRTIEAYYHNAQHLLRLFPLFIEKYLAQREINESQSNYIIHFWRTHLSTYTISVERIISDRDSICLGELNNIKSGFNQLRRKQIRRWCANPSRYIPYQNWMHDTISYLQERVRRICLNYSQSVTLDRDSYQIFLLAYHTALQHISVNRIDRVEQFTESDLKFWVHLFYSKAYKGFGKNLPEVNQAQLEEQYVSFISHRQ